MKKCPFCNAEIEENANFCLYCMTALNKKQFISNEKEKNKAVALSVIAAVIVFVVLGIVLLSPISNIQFTAGNVPSENEISSSQTLSPNIDNEEHSNSHNPIFSQPSSSSENIILTTTSNESVSSSPNAESEKSSSEDISNIPPPSATSSAASSATSSAASSNTENNDIIKALVYQLEGAEITILNCKETVSGSITIPDIIEGYPVTCISKKAFENCTSITSVDIPDSIEVIADSAFQNCTALNFVSLPDALFGDYVFAGCTSLTNVDFRSKDYCSWITTGTFYGCSALKTISLPATKHICDKAFYGCTNLESVYVPYKVKYIYESAFHNCKNLKDFYSYSDKSYVTIHENNDNLMDATWHIMQ